MPTTPAKKRTVAKKKTGTRTTPAAKAPKRAPKKRRTYTYTVGRRKSAVARVRWYSDRAGTLEVNGKPVEQYFPAPALQHRVVEPLELTAKRENGGLTIKVAGGGIRGQADAVRHGIARALVEVFPDTRSTLKKNGMLRRDARVKERKKYGLKRARRAPQWQKR